MAGNEVIVTPPMRQSVEDVNSAQANGIAQPLTEKSWYLFWDRLGKAANRQAGMITYGTHANRPDPGVMPDGALYVETDRGNVIYEKIDSAWRYVTGTMWDTLSPDHRPTDLGQADSNFDYRGTDQVREYIWTGYQWIDATPVLYGTHAARLALSVASQMNTQLYVEIDRGDVIYQVQGGAWQYVAGIMRGTMSPDQRPTDLGTNDAGFDFRSTDKPLLQYAWNGSAWVEITGANYAVNGTAIATQTGLNLIGGTNTSISGVNNAATGRVDVTITAAVGTGGAVTSVFGRTGNVAAVNGDYTAALVTNAVDQTSSYSNPAWITSLAWSKITGAPATGVSSVFGRTGAVTAASGDYSSFYVPLARQVIAGSGLTGGGALSADVTLTATAMGASGAGHSAGIVPDPGVTAGATRFLREDATWTSPQTPWLQNINGASFTLSNVGAIGIGISSPTGPLHVYKQVNNAPSGIIIDNGSSTGIGMAQAVQFAVGGPTVIGGIYHAYDGTRWNLNLAAWSNTTERTIVQIQGDTGYVGIMTTPSYMLHVATDSAAKPATNVWTIPSDIRTKRHVTRFEGDIEVIRKLNPTVAEYNGKAQTPAGTRVVSFDADELREIVPQCVTYTRGKLDPGDKEETDIAGINTHELFFHLLRAVQQIDRRLSDLEKK